MKTAEQFLLEYCELDEITPEDVVFTEYIPAMLNAYAEQAIREAAQIVDNSSGMIDSDRKKIIQNILNLINELK